jgi:hypothetical protein
MSLMPGSAVDVRALYDNGRPDRIRELARMQDDIVGTAGPWQCASPFLLSAADYQLLGDLTLRAAELVLASCMRRAVTAGDLLTALGSPPERFPLLDRAEPLGAHLLAAIRPDILLEQGIPRFVELNIDGALGGVLQGDQIASRFHDSYQRDGHGPEIMTPPPALDARARAIRETLGLPDGAAVLFPYYPVGRYREVDTLERFSSWLGPVFENASRHGMNMFTCPLEDLLASASGQLTADGRLVDAVFRPFVSYAQPASPGMSALSTALGAGQVRMFTSEATMLLTSKRTLAWLWEDLHLLSEDDRRFVATYIPWTATFATGMADGDSPGSLRQQDLVLKPADGFGGAEVMIGTEVSGQAWRSGLERALSHGGYVLQQHVAGDTISLPFVHTPTGEVRRADVTYVLGPFLYQRRLAGMVVRHAVPAGGPVLNANQGARLSTALLARG